jgi:hypothetical protein
VSGAKGRDKRPQFDALLKAAVRREFDMIAVWSSDRLGRSHGPPNGREPNPRSRGHLKVCALNNANSDKDRTRVSNGLVAFAELRFDILRHGKGGLLLGGEAA